MRQRFLITAVVAIVACTTVDARAGNWSDWAGGAGNQFTARFEPSVDTRQHSFSATDIGGYANVYGLTLFPGDVVVSLAPIPQNEEPTARPVTPGAPISVVVEAVEVSKKQDGRPKIDEGAHFAENPFLPFDGPSGKSEKPFCRIVLPTTAPSPGDSVSVPLRIDEENIQNLSHRHVSSEILVRVRWKVVSAAGHTLAKGVLPEAFSLNHSRGARLSIDATDGFTLHSYATRAFPATCDAWPLLATSAKQITLGSEWFDASFGEGSGRDPAQFVARARLIGIDLKAWTPDAAEKLAASGFVDAAPDIIVRKTAGRTVSDGATSLPSSRLCTLIAGNANDQSDAERKLEPVRIPGKALGRDGSKFIAATAIFLLAFAAGSVFLLFRFFAMRKGEARLAVWSAIPLWSAACAAFALLVVPYFLDRKPYADITEWRYGIEGVGEAFCTAIGRSHTFLSSPSRWSIPKDAWFASNWDSLAYNFSNWRSSHIQTVTLDEEYVFADFYPTQRGSQEFAFANRFIPHESPVSISPDPDFDREAFLSVAGMGVKPVPGATSEGDADEPDPKAAAALRSMLLDWTDADSLSMPFRKRPAPVRSVTAHQDLDAVYAFVRGWWYALGSMKEGETRTLDDSMRVYCGMDLSDKPWDNLFRSAPFAIANSDILRYAHAWLANADCEEGPKGESNEAEEGPEFSPTATHTFTSAEIKDDKQKSTTWNDSETGEIIERLGSAAVVALKKAEAEDGPFLRPEFPDSAGKTAITGRIAYMEVFP